MRWLVSWVLFWMGDAVSRVLHLLPDDTEWPSDLLYSIYNKLMVRSSRIQGDGAGPWKDVG